MATCLFGRSFPEHLIPISGEAWRDECEVAFLLGLPMAMKNEMIDRFPGPVHFNERGIDAVRGEGVAAMFRTEIERLTGSGAGGYWLGSAAGNQAMAIIATLALSSIRTLDSSDVEGLAADTLSCAFQGEPTREDCMTHDLTVEHLKAPREALVSERRQVAFALLTDNGREDIAKLAALHVAIEALDAVIAEGKGPPDGPGYGIAFI